MSGKIKMQCPNCGAKVNGKPEQFAKPINCPGCAERVKFTMRADTAKNRAIHQEINDSCERYQMKGVNSTLVVYDDYLTITPKGLMGLLSKGLKGTKEIPFHSIVAVQHKKSGILTSGYLQFTIPGGNESRGGIWDAVEDENTFMYSGNDNDILAEEVKQFINQQVRKAKSPMPAQAAISVADEIQKFAALKAQGVISDEEFQAMKNKLINN